MRYLVIILLLVSCTTSPPIEECTCRVRLKGNYHYTKFNRKCIIDQNNNVVIDNDVYKDWEWYNNKCTKTFKKNEAVR